MVTKYYNPSIVVVDGLDGVGKTTQINLLKERYTNVNFMKFPNYSSNTGFYIQKYLNGELNNLFKEMDYKDIISKISTLYTMDRLIWFKTHYDRYKSLICDRYTTSNIVHMGLLILKHGGTIDDVFEYLINLETLEYITLGIPKPNLVLFMDMPTELISNNLSMSHRVQDVHEDESIYKNFDLMKKQIIDYCGWKVIPTYYEDKINNTFKLKTIDDIQYHLRNILDDFYDCNI